MLSHLPVNHSSICKKSITMNLIFLRLFMFFYLASLSISAQQKYSGKSVLNCNNTDDSGPSPTFLYTCDSKVSSCQSFLIFRSHPPYNSVATISQLTSSDPSALANTNDVSSLTVFAVGKEVIVPVLCYCSGPYYQANSSYKIPSKYDTYFTIAKYTYQGLTTCDSLMDENVFSKEDLSPGSELLVPLRCACPTDALLARGTKYMLTYSIFLGDSITSISERFSVNRSDVLDANGFSENDPTIFPFTTILIPITVEPSSSQTVTRTPPIFSSPLNPPSNGKHKSKKMLLLGVGISVSFLVLVCIIIVIILLYHKVKLLAQKRKKQGVSRDDLLAGIANADRVLKVFATEDIKAATDNFNSFSKMKGSVYRGVLGGELVVIKKAKNNLWKEVKLLNKINHFNLIRLCGVCEDNGYSYLVYEYMENGCLRNWLCNKNHPSITSWSKRIQIALDVANGIHYLHNFIEPAYVHKDIKSSNVLLDGNLRAKIANFGLATATDIRGAGFVTSNFVGTRGYMAPEYLESGLVTPKFDVYAFGVVMMELITGKNSIMVHEGKEILLSAAIALIMETENMEGELCNFLDPSLLVNFRMDLAMAISKLSLACLKKDPASRPSMDEVVATLVKIQQDCEML